MEYMEDLELVRTIMGKLTKQGFLRTPRKDSITYDVKYRAHKLSNRVYTITSIVDNLLYVSLEIEETELTHSEYAELPHFKLASRVFCGVDVNIIADSDFERLYEYCSVLDEELKQLEASIVQPTVKELELDFKTLGDLRKHELDVLNDAMSSIGIPRLLLALAKDSPGAREFITDYKAVVDEAAKWSNQDTLTNLKIAGGFLARSLHKAVSEGGAALECLPARNCLKFLEEISKN